MEIRAAFPRVFKKAYPALSPQTQMFPAMSLLRFHDIDALPLESADGQKQRGIYGFSSLAKLVLLGPKDFASFLERPCEEASDELPSVEAKDSFEKLLDTFMKMRFGFAAVYDGEEARGLLGLSDVLELYDNGTVGTDLRLRDVASPIFSLPAETTLNQALKEMFRRRNRRVFIPDREAFISDREMIAHIFDPATLNAIARGSLDVLGTPLGMLQSKEPRMGSAEMTMKAAAAALLAEKGQCLVFDGRVVTPWDVVMKPWAAKALKVKNRVTRERLIRS